MLNGYELWGLAVGGRSMAIPSQCLEVLLELAMTSWGVGKSGVLSMKGVALVLMLYQVDHLQSQYHK